MTEAYIRKKLLGLMGPEVGMHGRAAGMATKRRN